MYNIYVYMYFICVGGPSPPPNPDSFNTSKRKETSVRSSLSQWSFPTAQHLQQRKSVSLPTQKHGHHKSCKSCFPPKRRRSVWTTIFPFQKRAAGRGQRKVPAESAIGANFPLSSLEQPDGIFAYMFLSIFMGFSCRGNIPVPWIVWVSVPDW